MNDYSDGFLNEEHYESSDGGQDVDEGIEEPLALDEESLIYAIGWHMDSQRRLYDIGLTLVAHFTGKENAAKLQQAHESGDFLYPPPWAQEADNE